MRILIISSILLIFSSLSCTNKDSQKYANILIKLNSITGLAASSPVKAKLYNSDNKLIAAASGMILSGNLNSLKLQDVDSSGNILSSYAQFDSGTYNLFVVIDNNANGSLPNGKYDVGEKIGYLTFSFTRAEISMFNGTITKIINDLDLTSSVMKPIAANLSAVEGKNAYCFWLKSPVQPILSVFEKTQELSTTTGIFSSGAVTVNSNYGNWPALIPGMTYNVYCFVDTNGNLVPDYNDDYEGSLTGVTVEASAQATVNVSFTKIVR